MIKMVPKLKLPKFSNVSVCWRKISNGRELLDKLKLIFLRARQFQVGNFSPERLRAKFRQSSEAKVLIFPSKNQLSFSQSALCPLFFFEGGFQLHSSNCCCLDFANPTFRCQHDTLFQQNKIFVFKQAVVELAYDFSLSCRKIDISGKPLFLKIASQDSHMTENYNLTKLSASSRSTT